MGDSEPELQTVEQLSIDTKIYGFVKIVSFAEYLILEGIDSIS